MSITDVLFSIVGIEERDKIKVWNYYNSVFFKKIIVTATSFTILLVGGLPDFCPVTEDVAPIKSDGNWSIGSSPCE